MPNATLLAFNASAVVNHDQDEQQGEAAQNDAIANAKGTIYARKLFSLPISTRLLLTFSSFYSYFHKYRSSFTYSTLFTAKSKKIQ